MAEVIENTIAYRIRGYGGEWAFSLRDFLDLASRPTVDSALHRLERRGWIRAKWGASENNRRAKYYELTKAGRSQLEAEANAWRKLTAAVGQVLETA